jgi:hypothetical protein
MNLIIHIVQDIFTWKPKWEKTIECFHIYHNITFIGSTNFQNYPSPTGRRHQPPVYRIQPEGGTNPLLTGSNLKEATYSKILQLQLEGGFNTLVYKVQP